MPTDYQTVWLLHTAAIFLLAAGFACAACAAFLGYEEWQGYRQFSAPHAPLKLLVLSAVLMLPYAALALL